MALTPLNATTDATVLSIEMKTFYTKGLINFAKKRTVFNQFGQSTTIPKNQGGTFEWRRPSQFTKVTGASVVLTEGGTPNGSALTFTKITASPSQYGDYYQGTDKIQVMTYDPILAIVTDQQAYQMAQVLDNLIQTAVIGGSTNVQWANGKTSTNTLLQTDIINETELRKAVRTLRRNAARPVSGSNFVAVIHPDTWFTLMQDPDIREVMIYAKEQNEGQKAGNLFTGELGTYLNITFVESPLAPYSANSGSVNIYRTVIFGQDYFGKVDISGLTAASIFKGVGSAGAADPLEQRWTQGWKMTHASQLLNELNAVILQHANVL